MKRTIIIFQLILSLFFLASCIEELPAVEKEFTISFNIHGGNPEIDVIKVKENQLIEEPKDIIKSGFNLEGWYINDEFTREWKFLHDVVKSDLTLHANWIKEEEPSFSWDNILVSKNKNSYSLALLPDTQIYATNFELAEIFYSQTKWIKENSASHRIKFSAHLGDIVDRASNLMQWNVADKAFDILDEGNIPYGVTAGNHDFRGLSKDTSFYLYDDSQRATSEFYLRYFGKDRTSKVIENYGGHSDNEWNSYYYFEGNGRTYLVLFVDFAASNETFQWANKILNENSDIPTILVSHIIVRPKSPQPNANIEYSEAQKFYDELIHPHNQVFLTFNGHYIGQGRLTKKNAYGNDVTMVVFDYQGEHKGGNGMMNLVEFDEDSNKIFFQTFSPYVMMLSGDERDFTKDFVHKTDNRNRFELDFDFNKRFNFTHNE